MITSFLLNEDAFGCITKQGRCLDEISCELRMMVKLCVDDWKNKRTDAPDLATTVTTVVAYYQDILYV